MKVIFKKGPAGRFGLGYHVGETAELPEPLAQELINEGYAMAVKPAPNKVVAKDAKPKTQTAKAKKTRREKR